MEHRQLSLMFTDIVGYSRLMGQDEAKTIELLGEYRRILLAAIEHFKGTVIEFIGDAVFARFDTPLDAVNAGVEIQNALSEFNCTCDRDLPKLQSRIGIHMGEVALKEEALFGDDVNIAARLEPIAVADGLCVSESVYRAVKDDIDQPVLPLGVQPLKNIQSKIKAYLIRPAGINKRTRFHYAQRKLQQKISAYRYPITACVLIFIAAGFYFVPRWLVPGYTANYVEIADFKNLMSETGEADYFSAGVTEALRSQLADIQDVYIVEPDKGVRGPLRLEGSIQKVGDSLRIAYRLLRLKDDVQIAGGKLDGAYSDIFILQDRVVAEIAKYLAKEFKLPNFRPAKLNITSDVLAYDLYLRGLDWLNKPSSEENMDEAIKFFTTALVHDKNFPLANAGLCQAFWVKFSLTQITDLLVRAEDYCNTALSQDQVLPKALESMGIIYAATGRYDEAIAMLSGVLEKDPGNMTAVQSLAKVYSLQGSFDEAETIVKAAIDLKPENWLGYQTLGLIYLRSNQIEQALTVYKRVLELTPKNAGALSNLGTSYYYLGEIDKAAKYYSKSVELLPSSWAYSNAGAMYYFSSDYRKSIDMLKQAARLSPDDYMIYMNMADAQRQLNLKSQFEDNYQSAVKMAKKHLEVNEKNVVALWVLARSYMRLGLQEKANQYLNKASSVSPDDVEVLYTKLVSLCESNDIDGAIQVLEKLVSDGYSKKLIALDPDLGVLREDKRYQRLIADV